MSKQNNIKVKITITSNNGQQVLYRTGSNASQLVRKEYEKAKKDSCICELRNRQKT